MISEILLTALSTNEGTLNDTVHDIAQSTNSELIHFIILILIGLVIFFIPYYLMKRKWNKADNDSDIAEKKLLIDVINRNTEVISNLKGTIVNNNLSMTTLLSDIVTATSETNKALLKISVTQDNTNQVIQGIVSDTNEVKDSVHQNLDQYRILIGIDQNLNNLHEDIRKLLESFEKNKE